MDYHKVRKDAIDTGALFQKKSLQFFHYLSLCVFALFTIFVILLFISPLLIQTENPVLMGAGASTYNLVSIFMMCHQLPMRTFFIAGVQQAVCARDIGIYIGMVLAGLVFIVRRPDFFKTKKFLLLTVIPILLDGGSQTILNLRESNNFIRIVTGLIFGFGLMYAIVVRIKRLNGFEFNENIRNPSFLTILGVSFLVIIIGVLSISSMMGAVYVSRADAIVLSNSTQDAMVYYIPPRTALAYYFYPNKDLYDDQILDEIEGMQWVKDQINLFTNQSYLINNTNLTSNFFSADLPLVHYYGIWVVHEKPGVDTIGAVYSNTPGRYVYIDALTSEVFHEITY